MKKLIILISVIIIFFIFFLYMYFSPRNYEKKYKVDKVLVIEKYNKNNEYYYIKLKYKEKTYEYATTDKYTTKRGLIKNIKIKKEEGTVCLVPLSNYLTTYPLCYKDDKQIAYTLTDIQFNQKKVVEQIATKYKDITINYLNNKTFLVWNYKGFNYINKDIKKTINFLEKDSYNLDLVAQVDNYVLVPDYDNDHTFNKMYIINLKKGTVDNWDLEYNIYFDSYIVGVKDNSVFIFDKKNKLEYELRPDKKKMRKVKFKAIIDGKWESLSLGELNKETTFSFDTVHNYEVINNKLYLKYLDGNAKVLISNRKVKDIVHIDNDTVYYLVDDKLYMYNEMYGEVLLMDYFEWNFNYKNMVFVY